MTYSLYKCYPTILPICCIFHNFQVTMPISPRIILAQRINSIAKMIRDVYAVLNRRKKRYIILKKTSLCPPCARRAFPCPPCFRGGAQRPFAMDRRRRRPPLAEGGLLDPLSETMPYPFEMAFLELELIPVWTLHIRKGNGWVTVCDIHLIHAEGITGNSFRVCLAGASILVNAVHAGGAERLRAHFI